jgi:hypothetical protein
MSYYTQQLAEQLGGSDKGPSGPSFLPEHFQYMQASTGPVGQRGPQGLRIFGFVLKLQLICMLLGPSGSVGPQGFQGIRGEAGEPVSMKSFVILKFNSHVLFRDQWDLPDQ